MNYITEPTFKRVLNNQKEKVMKQQLITSYKDLVKLLQNKKIKDVLCIKNVVIPFELNLHQLLEDAGLCIGAERKCLLSQSSQLIIENARCKNLLVEELFTHDIRIDFRIKDSYIEEFWINSCHFHSLDLINTNVKTFGISNSHIDGEADLWFARDEKLGSKIINIEDTIFGGNLKISNLMLYKEFEFNIGSNSVISKDCIISDTIISGGLLDIRGKIIHDLRFNFINYQGEVDYFQHPLNYGNIELHDAIVGNELVFLNCHIDELGITNCDINGIREFSFSYNKLQYGAAVALRNAALKKSDIILLEKYSSEIYDALIHENSTKAYRRWASRLNGESIKRKFGIRDCFYKYVFEPIRLLIPSFSYNEGLLLWLNKYSNDYNRSWKRGIFFTLIITLISYFLLNYFGMEEPFFVFDPQFDGFGEVVKGYLSLLDIFNLTNLSDKISFKLSPCGYLLLLFFKVFITYGCWQTIYAFFKFKK